MEVIFCDVNLVVGILKKVPTILRVVNLVVGNWWFVIYLTWKNVNLVVCKICDLCYTVPCNNMVFSGGAYGKTS